MLEREWSTVTNPAVSLRVVLGKLRQLEFSALSPASLGLTFTYLENSISVTAPAASTSGQLPAQQLSLVPAGGE